MAKNDIPVLVKHCALAIFKSGDVKGSVMDKTLGAFDIARHRLTEYGFLKKGSEVGDPSKIKLTSKGFQAESKHQREGAAGKAKTREWDKLYRVISEAEEESTDDGAMNQLAALPAVAKPGPKERKKQDQVRRVKVAKRRTRRARVPRAKKAKRG